MSAELSTSAAPRILHVVSDYPGPHSPRNVTNAIHDLLESSECARHFVLVPRRTKRQLWSRTVLLDNQAHVSIFDPFATLLPGKNLRKNWLRLCRRQWLGDQRIDLVHSHKLTYEARIGARLAASLRVPHLITVQGSSDTHPLNHWPWTSATYRRLLQESACNLWMSAWAREPITRLTGYVPGPRDLLFPCAVPDELAACAVLSQVFDEDRLACVCRLDDYLQKCIPELLAGLACARVARPGLRLDLIGPASDSTRQHLLGLIAQHGLADVVQLSGPIPRERLMQHLSRYAGLVLVSRAESFGLVYVEALLAGVPIIYRRDSGVAGHEFAQAHGVECADVQPAGVEHALVEFGQRQHELRARLHAALSRGELAGLMASGQAAFYRRVVEDVLARAAVQAKSTTREAA